MLHFAIAPLLSFYDIASPVWSLVLLGFGKRLVLYSTVVPSVFEFLHIIVLTSCFWICTYHGQENPNILLYSS